MDVTLPITTHSITIKSLHYGITMEMDRQDGQDDHQAEREDFQCKHLYGQYTRCFYLRVRTG